MCESMSKLRINSSARSPKLPAATPKNIANTTICNISFVPSASKILFGKICTTKSCKLNLVLVSPVVAVNSGIGKLTPTPGVNKFTINRPSNREIVDILKNQAKVFNPTRPIVEAFPIREIPTTRVLKTNGAIIILIKRKKISVKIEAYSIY